MDVGWGQYSEHRRLRHVRLELSMLWVLLGQIPQHAGMPNISEGYPLLLLAGLHKNKAWWNQLGCGRSVFMKSRS